LSQEDSKFAELVLEGEKNTIFHLKHYNLAIYEVKFFETVSTYHFNGPKQDLTVESQKIKKQKIYTICIRSGSFGMVFSKT
jgi:hypothetical protein